MRLLARLDEPELLEPVPDGIIGSERTRPRLELSESVELGTTKVEWIRHLFPDPAECASARAKRPWS